MYEIVIIVWYVGIRETKSEKEARNNEESRGRVMQCGGRIWVEERREEERRLEWKRLAACFFSAVFPFLFGFTILCCYLQLTSTTTRLYFFTHLPCKHISILKPSMSISIFNRNTTIST